MSINILTQFSSYRYLNYEGIRHEIRFSRPNIGPNIPNFRPKIERFVTTANILSLERYVLLEDCFPTWSYYLPAYRVVIILFS